MVNFFNKSYFDAYLKNQGYRFIEDMSSSRFIDLVENPFGKITVIKRDKEYDDGRQTLIENEILGRLKGLKGLPNKILFRKDILSPMPKKSKVFVTDVRDYFLEEQFIDGEDWTDQQLSTVAEQTLIDLVNTFHKEGYARMDLFEPNFRISLDEELYYIDAGNCIKKNHPHFKECVGLDIQRLERLLKESRVPQELIENGI